MTDQLPITRRRTFPESEPGTDGVAESEGRTIGRVYRMDLLPVSRAVVLGVPDPDLNGRPGTTSPLSGETTGPREAMRLAEHHWRRVKASVEAAAAYWAKKG